MEQGEIVEMGTHEELFFLWISEEIEHPEKQEKRVENNHLDYILLFYTH